MIVAVLDACVLIPSVLADTLLRCAECELFRPVWSADILHEVRRNLPASVTPAGADRRIAAMRRFFPDAEATGYHPVVPNLTNHPKDRHVLAAAIVSDAEFIVTANLRDFPPVAVDEHAIEAVHPDDFLCDLFDAAPEVLFRVINEQAQATGAGGRPKLSVDDVLVGLDGTRATRFAHRIRSRFPG